MDIKNSFYLYHGHILCIGLLTPQHQLNISKNCKNNASINSAFIVMYDFSRAHNNMFSINVCKWLELSVDCIHLSSQLASRYARTLHTHTAVKYIICCAICTRNTDMIVNQITHFFLNFTTIYSIKWTRMKQIE